MKLAFSLILFYLNWVCSLQLHSSLSVASGLESRVQGGEKTCKVVLAYQFVSHVLSVIDFDQIL